MVEMSNHTSTIVGGSMFSGGIVGEVSKKEAPMNLMDFDILFGLLMPHFYLTITGLLAITGTIILVLTFIRNSKNDDWIEKIVKKPKKRLK
jgi:hypothetical protein